MSRHWFFEIGHNYRNGIVEARTFDEAVKKVKKIMSVYTELGKERFIAGIKLCSEAD